MDLDAFRAHADWIKVWSGGWSIHSCSQFGEEWTVDNQVLGKPAWTQVAYIYRQGISDCWVSRADKDDFGARLIAQAKSDPNGVRMIAGALKEHSDRVLAFVRAHGHDPITLDWYNAFWKIISDYYLQHISVKYIVDYFSPEELERHLPVLEEARVYAEPVFHEQEHFMEHIAEEIACISGLTKNQVLSTTKEELRAYVAGTPLPAAATLDERWNEAALFFERGEYQLFSGAQAHEMEKMLLPQTDAREIRGQVAYSGLSRGVVRIVFDPLRHEGTFDEGDILVTGMTRPDFLPLMKKSGAIVTDAGGILSHAAITARELRKPCVIGTGTATKVFKDGDLVEVDADAGVVRIIKRT